MGPEYDSCVKFLRISAQRFDVLPRGMVSESSNDRLSQSFQFARKGMFYMDLRA
jgi:hypothetical protein